MHPPTDELLLGQARKGNPQAFVEVVRRYQGAVYSLCYRMMGDATEAEDLAQEAFLNLYPDACFTFNIHDHSCCDRTGTNIDTHPNRCQPFNLYLTLR